MAPATSLSGLESLNCDFVLGQDTNISRWSDTNIDRPALLVTPETEQHIQAAIQIARLNNLTIVTSGGGHGAFVPVASNTLYLDMKKFKTIQLNKNQGTVTVGGGVICGEVLETLAAEGYYTPLPNSNGVGVVGCLLGGGNTAWLGIHGWMADIVVSFRVVNSSGDVVEVSSSSEGKELSLFNALCGAGNGLGVVTSVETSAFPISSLGMADDKIWTRSLVFPFSALDTAVQTFTSLSTTSPATSNIIMVARSPPGTPAAGKPIVVVGSTCLGPVEEAEKAAAALFDEEVVAKAVMATTEMLPVVNVNDRFKIFDAHGGHKTLASCRLKKVDPETIKATVAQWLAATEKYPDSQRSPIMLASFDTAKLSELGQSRPGAAKFLESRDRSLAAMMVLLCDKEESMTALTESVNGIMGEFRKADEGFVARSIANNLRFGIDREEMFDGGRLAELKGIKESWDADGIFWSPYSL